MKIYVIKDKQGGGFVYSVSIIPNPNSLGAICHTMISGEKFAMKFKRKDLAKSIAKAIGYAVEEIEIPEEEEK